MPGAPIGLIVAAGRKEQHMGRTFSFRDYMLKYDCPFCGNPQSGLEVEPGSQGQSILWIALECIRAGAALPPCRSCGCREAATPVRW